MNSSSRAIRVLSLAAIPCAIGGCISLLVNGTWMLVVASGICALTTGITYFHMDRRAVFD